MVKVADSGVQVEEFSRSFLPLESLLLSFLTPCRTVGLFDNVVAPGCGDHLLVVDIDQAWDLSNRGSVAAELVGVDDLWDIIFSQQPGHEDLRRFSIPMPLEENVEHKPVLVYGPAQPMSDAVHACTHLVEMPPGTPSGFPVAQVFSEEGSELYAPLAEGFVTDLNAALVEQFLNVSVTDGKTVVQPNGVLDDGHRETVAVWLGVGHGGSAYPDPIKATQPLGELLALGLAARRAQQS